MSALVAVPALILIGFAVGNSSGPVALYAEKEPDKSYDMTDMA